MLIINIKGRRERNKGQVRMNTRGRREWNKGQMCIILIQADNTSRGDGRHVYAERDSGREDPLGGTKA